MRILLCFLVFALPLVATDSTATITTPDALNARLATVIEKWIQVVNTPTIKYPGATQALRRQSLLDSVLREGMRDKFKLACNVFPDDCAAVKAAKEDQAAAAAAIAAAIENIIQ